MNIAVIKRKLGLFSLASVAMLALATLAVPSSAYADSNGGLTEVSREKVTIDYRVGVKGFNGDGTVTVDWSTSGSHASFNTFQVKRNISEINTGQSNFTTGSKGIGSSKVPSIVNDWSTQGKDFKIFVDGQEVASGAAGDVHHVSILWEGMINYLTGYQDQAMGAADIYARLWDSSWNSQQVLCRPMGSGLSNAASSSGSWKLLDTRASNPQVSDWQSHTIELVRYDRTQDPDDQPSTIDGASVSLFYSDGNPYHGEWTNKDLKLSLKQFGEQYASFLVLNGTKINEGRAQQSLNYAITTESKSKDGDAYMVALKSLNSGLNLYPKERARIDKTAPVISVTYDKNTGKFTDASTDALSGVKSVEAAVAKFGTEPTDYKPLSNIAITADGTYQVKVRVTDNAGNVAEQTLTITKGEPTDPGNGGDTSSGTGDGFAIKTTTS